MQFNDSDTPEQHAAKVAQLYQDERKRSNKRLLEIATVALLTIGGATLTVETDSYLWMAFGGAMAFLGLVRASDL